MPHTTEVVNTFEEGGAYVAEILCCGEHTFRHTMLREALLNNRDASIAEGHKLAAKSHEAKLNASAHLESLLGHKVKHDI